MERLVRFSLYGQEFSFYSEAPENEVDEIVALVKAEVESQGQGVRGTVLSSRLAVLASLRIAAKYIDLEKEFERYRQEQEKRIEHILASLAPVIGERQD